MFCTHRTWYRFTVHSKLLWFEFRASCTVSLVPSVAMLGSNKTFKGALIVGTVLGRNSHETIALPNE